jgi:hypothetical protein
VTAGRSVIVAGLPLAGRASAHIEQFLMEILRRQAMALQILAQIVAEAGRAAEP